MSADVTFEDRAEVGLVFDEGVLLHHAHRGDDQIGGLIRWDLEEVLHGVPPPRVILEHRKAEELLERFLIAFGGGMEQIGIGTSRCLQLDEA